jgi:hypothetical protein
MRTIPRGTFAAGLALAAGCYGTARVPPTELPKLNGATVYTTQLDGATGETATVRHLLDERGRVVEVAGRPTVTLGLRDGARQLEYRAPILSSVSADGALLIADGRHAQREIPLADIDYAEVRWLDRQSSGATAGLLAAAGAILIFGIGLAASN